MRSFNSKFLAWFLALQFFLTPGMTILALAQDTTPQAASDDEVETIQQLAKAGYLGDKKDFYLNEKNMTEADVTDALLKANDYVMGLDVKNLSDVKPALQTADLQSLLDLAKDKSADIRARKASAWKLENRLGKVIAQLAAPAATASASSDNVPAPTATPVPPPPTATPVPGPSKEEFNLLRQSFKDLDGRVTALQVSVDQKSVLTQKLQDSNDDLKTDIAGNQEQLKLVKKLIDRVQEDMKKTEDRMDEMNKKIDQKLVTDTQMRQEITVMHKDLRDDTEDLSVLKQEVAKLDKTDYGPKNAIDEFLNSKWLPGAALLVGLTALTVSIVRK